MARLLSPITFAVAVAATLVGVPQVSIESQSLPYPAARREPVFESYGAERIADPYRWLEQLEAAETQAWVSAQEALLAAIAKGDARREETRRRLLELVRYESYGLPVHAGHRVFYTKSSAGGATAVLYVEEGGQSRAVLDVASRLGVDARLGAYVPNRDGRLIALLLRRNQSNWNELRVLDVDRGVLLDDRLTNIYSFTGRVAWAREGTGFFYTAFEAPSGSVAVSAARNARVFYHTVGWPQAEDQQLAGLPLREGWLYSHVVSDDGRWLVVTTTRGTSQHDEVYVARLGDGTPRVKPLVVDLGAALTFLGAEADRLFFYTDFHAEHGRVVAIDVDAPDPPHWTELVPEKADAIAARDQTGGNALGMYGNRFVLVYLRDGQPYIVVYDLSGKSLQTMQLPTAGAIWGGFSGKQSDSLVFYSFLGLTDPSTIYRWDVKTGAPAVFKSSPVPGFDRERYEVRQVFVTSRDGTRVPMFIAHRKGLALDGQHRTWMYGYGAMGWVSFLYYQPQILLWLERGGVYAQPSLRGGGEYGRSWHRAGSGINEQNTVDDFIAAARWLIAQRYTASRSLVAHGGSLSGALAATAMNQAPRLFGAALIDRPVLDLLRFDQFTGGAYWAGELGSPNDPAANPALLKQSPYHNLKPGTCYPATLVMSGDLDQTAVPPHAYKYVAALQHAQSCSRPVALKVMRGAGHNFGTTPETIADSYTDALMFLDRVLPSIGRQKNEGRPQSLFIVPRSPLSQSYP